MEVKINKEIREYSENMFFGLTLRQFFFSVMGCITAVGIYFICRDAIGLELTTWLCVLGVVPFAAIGFITYNGMPAEKIVIAYMKSKLIYPKRYLSKPVSFYYSMMENVIGLKQGSLSRKQKRKMNREKKRKRGKRK